MRSSTPRSRVTGDQDPSLMTLRLCMSEMFSNETYNNIYVQSMYKQWRIQAFQKGGRGPGAVEFLGLGFVLMSLHTYSMCL